MKYFGVDSQVCAVTGMRLGVALVAVAVCLGGCGPVTFSKQRFQRCPVAS